MTKIVYMDHAATSLKKPECVCAAMDHFMRHVGASPGRATHEPGLAAGRIVEHARHGAALLFGLPAPKANHVVFTLNCTEALNLVIRGHVKPGSHVVTTSMEHNSVMRPLRHMQDNHEVTVSCAKADATGITVAGEIERLIRADTSLVIMVHASNVTGAIQPIEEWGRIARERGIPFLVDAAQTAGCLPILLPALPVDYLAFSGHKALLAAQGVGGLFLGNAGQLPPLRFGGTGSRSGSTHQPDMLPDKYESGTPNTPGLAALGAALDWTFRRTWV